jgi:hypothetical protein
MTHRFQRIEFFSAKQPEPNHIPAIIFPMSANQAKITQSFMCQMKDEKRKQKAGKFPRKEM